MKNINYGTYGSGMIDVEAKERSRVLDKIIKILSLGVIIMVVVILGGLLFR